MTKRSIAIILFLICMIAAACSLEGDIKVVERELDEPEEQETINDIELDVVHAQHPDTAQAYTIIHTFNLYETYFSKLKDGMKQAERDALFKEEVMDLIFEPCIEDGEHIHMAALYLKDSPQDQFGIERVMKQTNKDVLNEQIFSALIDSSNHLPTDEKTIVCIFPNTRGDDPMMITIGSGQISVLYNLTYPEEMMKVGIAHEYHHSNWTERQMQHSETSTVLDNLILKGMAVAFEKIVYPGNGILPDDPPYEQHFWDRIEPDLYKEDFSRTMEILFGGGNLPNNYGYLEGYNMVKSYLAKHPTLSPPEWLYTDPQVILDEGEHLSNYE